MTAKKKNRKNRLDCKPEDFDILDCPPEKKPEELMPTIRQIQAENLMLIRRLGYQYKINMNIAIEQKKMIDYELKRLGNLIYDHKSRVLAKKVFIQLPMAIEGYAPIQTEFSNKDREAIVEVEMALNNYFDEYQKRLNGGHNPCSEEQESESQLLEDLEGIEMSERRARQECEAKCGPPPDPLNAEEFASWAKCINECSKKDLKE